MHTVHGVSSFEYSKFRKVEFFLMFVSCFKPKTILKLCLFINNQIGANRRSSLFGTQRAIICKSLVPLKRYHLLLNP